MMCHPLGKTKRVWELNAVYFQPNTKRLLCFHVWLRAVQKALAVILHFKITLCLLLILFLGSLLSDQIRVPALFFCQALLRSSFNFTKDWTELEMRRGRPCLQPDPSRGKDCGTELRKLNWPSTHIISATPRLADLPISVESRLAGFHDSCYAERNVNRVPGGAGMWVKRSISEQLMWFLSFWSSSVWRLPRCSQRRSALREDFPYGIDLSVYCSVTAGPAEPCFSSALSCYSTVFRDGSARPPLWWPWNFLEHHHEVHVCAF